MLKTRIYSYQTSIEIASDKLFDTLYEKGQAGIIVAGSPIGNGYLSQINRSVPTVFGKLHLLPIFSFGR